MSKNIDVVVDAFEAGRPKIGSESAHTTGNVVASYYTVIAVREDDNVIINTTRYSNTTSKLQSALKRTFPNALLVDGLDRGARESDLVGAISG